MIAHNPKELAMFIKSYRKKQGLKQSDVSDAVGLKQATMSAFENNPATTKIDTLFRILSATNLDIHITLKNETTDSSDWHEEW